MASDESSHRPPARPVEPVRPTNPAVAASSFRTRLQLAAIGALVIGYAALSQYSSSARAAGLGAALSLAPVLAIGVILAWRWTQPRTAMLMAALACAGLYRYWPFVEKNYEWADLAQQCGVYGLVALIFARSLFAHRIPVCTQLAEKMYGMLTPVEIAYTRRATVAWTGFYALLTAAILILFFAVSLSVWSLFVNFATFGLMMIMGVVDHVIRRRVLPRHPGGGILEVIKRSLLG